jgi:hypothetical protein
MSRAKQTRRGSPEAIAKRKAARTLNRIFDRQGATSAIDGRTLKRKKRLLAELKDGRGGEALRAHEVLSHVTELLALGESIASIRKLKPRLPPAPTLDATTIQAIRETQESYGFDARAWKVLGIDIVAVMGDDARRKKKPAT